MRTGGVVMSRCTTSSTANPTWTAWGANPGRQLTAVTMTTAYRVPYIGIYKFTSTDPTLNCLHEAQVQQRRMLRPCTSGIYRRVVYKRSPMFRTNLLPHLQAAYATFGHRMFIRYITTRLSHYTMPPLKSPQYETSPPRPIKT